jgi:hypothetical protein
MTASGDFKEFDLLFIVFTMSYQKNGMAWVTLSQIRTYITQAWRLVEA